MNLYPDSFIVNGDKPFIKITNERAFACGTPWNGKEGWNTNTMVPLRAIFLLERVNEGEKSSVEEISIGKAFPVLLQQTYHPSSHDALWQTIRLLKEMDGKTRFFRFRSTPTSDAIQLAYEAASRGDNSGFEALLV